MYKFLVKRSWVPHRGERITFFVADLSMAAGTVCSCYVHKPKKIDKEIIIRAAGYSETFDDKDDKFIFLSDLKSTVTGKGYGTVFMKKLIKYCKETGKNRIYLNVDKDNEDAHRFYKRFGFIQKWEGHFNYRYLLEL